MADTILDDSGKTKDGSCTPGRAWQNYLRAYEYDKAFNIAAREDIEFALGKQWDPKDVATLEERGVRALTINKINPVITLMAGIESQNRSDFKVFPVGKEDALKAEASTALLKYVTKNADVDFKVSEQWEEGIICGKCFLEPFVDTTDDLINPDLLFKKLSYDRVLIDPDSVEYDHSDAQYACKVTTKLSKDQVLQLFPDADLENVAGGRIDIDTIGTVNANGMSVEKKNDDYGTPGMAFADDKDRGFDLMEYYYKKYVKKYLVLDPELKTLKEVVDKKEADTYIKAATETQPDKQPPKLITKIVPEIWYMALLGGSSEPLEHGVAWFYPKWKGLPFVPYYAKKSTAPIDKIAREYLIQGIVRTIKDLNRELNKRRTQELRHLNQSANSGWQVEEGSVSEQDLRKYEDFGSVPGVILKHKLGKPAPVKILPTPLSQGHAQLAAENAQDMKEVTGINTDLLAMDKGGTDSGRAIALRQKQGLVMVQKLFDNLSRTKKILGRFILSQLSVVMDVEKCMVVLGEAWLQTNFMTPVLDQNGQPVMDPRTMQPQMAPDMKGAQNFFNNLLEDSKLGKFDVTIGETINSETIQYANYSQLMDMAKNGMPIPPDVIIEESTLSASSKERIISAIEQARQMPQPAPAKSGGKRA